MTNIRRTLAVKIQTPGGDNPLRMSLVGKGPFYRGIAVTGLALIAQGGTAPYSFSIISGGDTHGGVDGLTLNADGTFSGSPDEAGRFIFIAQVQDSASNVFSHSFSLTVLPQLIVVAGTPTPGENLLAYTYQFIVRDLAGTTITSGYSVTSGTITPGLSLSGAGILSGNPSFAAVGFNYFTVTVTNGSDSIDIPVVQRIYDPLLSFGIEFKTYLYAGIEQTLSAYSSYGPTGGLEPYHIRWDNLDDYPWLTYDDNTKTFTGVTPFENIGVEQTLTGTIVDGLGATLSHLASFTPVFAQAGISVAGDLIHAPAETGYTVFGSSDGSVQITPDTSGGLDFKATGGGGGGQAAIQFKDEGSNLGTSGTATSFNVVGAGGALARVGNALTLTIPGSTGGIQTIEGVHPDSSGNINVDGIAVDSNGGLSVTQIEGSLTLSIGREGGAILLSGTSRTFLVPARYVDASHWWLAVSPNATTQLDIWVHSFGSARPTSADSIVSTHYPTVTAAASATGTTSGWGSTALTQGAYITFYIRSNDVATQILFELQATRTL